jgi:hypothetical protein
MTTLSDTIILIKNANIKYVLFDFDKTLTKVYSDNGQITDINNIIIAPTFYKTLFQELQKNNITVGIISFGSYHVIAKYINDIMNYTNLNTKIKIFTPRLYEIKGSYNNYTEAIFNINNNYTDNEYTEYFNLNGGRVLTKYQMITDFILQFNDTSTKPEQVIYFDDSREHVINASFNGVKSICVKDGVDHNNFHTEIYERLKINK